MPSMLEEQEPSRPAYFWWGLANAIALCFAVISWVVCLDLFGNPEIARNYKVLGLLGRQPELKRYSIVNVPNGNALGPSELYRKFFGYTDEQEAKTNSLLLRNYITNFERPQLITYVEGHYEIREVRRLVGKDFFAPGIVVRAQAMVTPDDFSKPLPYPVWIEYLFPTAQVEKMAALKPGDLLALKKSPNCAVVIHRAKMMYDGEPALILTVVPIAYGLYPLGNLGALEIEPPPTLRLDAPLPVTKRNVGEP